MAVVLVFGTDPVALSGLAGAIRAAGHTPFAESVPAAALPEVRAGLFDVVILDGRCPGSDEICLAAQRPSTGSKVPVVLLDERGEPGRTLVCVDAVFYKPIKPDRVARVVGLLGTNSPGDAAPGNAEGRRAAGRRPDTGRSWGSK
jgi:DNA-binding response OmpR family regulator